MSSLRADITALVKQQRVDGLKVVSLDALELVLHPRHRLEIDHVGGPTVTHPRACVDRPHCDLANAVATAHLVSSPHARGRTYEVWLDDATTLKFLDVTP